MIISFLLYLSMYRSSGNSNSNVASVKSNFGIGLRQFDGTAAQSLRFLQNIILRVFLLINFNIITRNYCLNKTTLSVVVTFLLSVIIDEFFAVSVCIQNVIRNASFRRYRNFEGILYIRYQNILV